MQDNNRKRTHIDRRSALKTLGVGTASLSAIPVGRATALSQEQFEGVVYDPVDKRILGQGYGTITRGGDTLDGHLELDGLDYALNTSVVDTSSDERTEIFIERTGNAILDVFSTEESALSGLVTQTGNERIAFYLGSQRYGMNPDELRASIEHRQPTRIVHKTGKSPRERGERR